MRASPVTAPTKFAILLPDEIIFHILHFLNPREVIRLRLVSKQFYGVTRDARLWRAFYVNSCLPRPPGPFLWQSAQYLEHVLIHSARVSQTWTSQPVSVVSRVLGPRIPTKPSPVSTSSDFLFGRLFIWCEGEQLFAQDLETGIGRLLWEDTELISSVSACSLTLFDSERVFIALRHVDEPVADRTPIKLLEFPILDDVRLSLGPVISEMDLPRHANFPLSASAHFLYFDGGIDRLFGFSYEPLVFNARTRVVYGFPTFSSCIDAVIHKEPRPWWPGFTLLTGSHIIVFRPWWHWAPRVTLIQAFVAPDPTDASDADTTQLRLSHEILVENCYAPTHHLRSPIVDPTTGETRLRLLSADAHTHDGQTTYVCVDVTIPPADPGSEEVLPMFVESQHLLILAGHMRTIFLDASSDGHGRGIVTMSVSEPEEPEEDPVVLYKFAIDASVEQCAVVLSEPSRLHPEDVFQYAHSCVFDGVRGRICHDRDVRSNFYDLVVLSLN